MTNDKIWYIAEVIMEITVTGDDRNVVHHNHFLVSADSKEEAFEKAHSLGKRGETTYRNPAGEDVRITFIGVADLDEIHDELGDGAEVLYRYQVGVSKADLKAMIPSKARLRVFAPRSMADGPDYASAEVVDLVNRESGIKRPV